MTGETAQLATARFAGIDGLRHGLSDTLVRPSHALRAFNQLARPGDRLGPQAIESVEANVLPPHLQGRIDAPTYFRGPDPQPLFSRRWGSTAVVLSRACTTWCSTRVSSGWPVFRAVNASLASLGP
jgi:hypothetical protein